MKPPVLQSRQVGLNEVHEQVHRGNSYVLSHIFPGLASGSAAAWLLFQGITHTHLVFDVRSGGDAEIYLFENPTVSASGTAVVPVNLNRPLAFGSALVAYHSPTVTVSGGALYEALLPGASGIDLPPGTLARQGNEWILNITGSVYLLLAVNATNGLEAMSFNIEFYEEALW